MKNPVRSLLAAWRSLWLAWLRLLTWPWRWLLSLRDASRGTAGPEAGPSPAPPAAAPEAGAAAREAPEPAVLEEAGVTQRAVAELHVAEAPEAAVAPAAVEAPAEPAEPAPSAEPKPKPVRAGRFSEGSYRNDAGQRDYKLYVPPGKPDGPLPMVVMLHGCKQDPDDFAAGTGMNRVAAEQPMLVLYPAQAKAANAFGCWNWFNRHDQQANAGEPSIIAGMVQEVMARHSVDSRRVYLAGLSAGGAMVATLVHTHPTLFAAAGIHSGLAYAAAQDMITALGVMKRGPAKRAAPAALPEVATVRSAARPHVPLIVFHGDADTTVHPLNGESVVEQALAEWPASGHGQGAGIVVEQGQADGGHAYTRTLHSNGTAQPHLEHWLVHGAGHAWCGGNPEGTFTDPLGPDASREMLRFFLQHTLT